MSVTPLVREETHDWTGPAVSGSWFEACAHEAEEWLIAGLVPRRSYTGIFGRRGSAKSFLALDMAACGALGRPFLGLPVEPFGSIYCVGEKKARFGKRVEAWRKAHGLSESIGVRLRWACPNLLDDDDVDAFIAEAAAMRPDFAARGVPLGAVFLDTLWRALPGGNVSDPTNAGQALASIQRIIDSLGVAVLPIAHVAKADGAITQKGAGEWEDAADALIRIDRKEQDPVRTVTLAKQSDEADGLTFAFTLEVVELGTNAKGRTISSCVIRQTEAPDSGTNRPAVRLTAEAQTVLSAIDRLGDAGQTEAAPNVPGVRLGTRAVRVEALRAQSFDLGLKEGLRPDANAKEPEQRKWKETRRKAFQRAVEKLCEAGRARQEGDLIWRV